MSKPRAVADARVRRPVTRRIEPMLYIAPAFVVLGLVVGFPVFSAIGTSFLHASLLKPGQDSFAGLSNYVSLFGDAEFLSALWRTFVWAGAALVIQTSLALGIALVLNRKLVGRGLFRTVLIVPWVVPTILVALIWRYLLDPVSGPVTEVLGWVGFDSPPIWLADPTWAMPTLLLISAWKWTPFSAVVILAGLQQIPQEHYEAAAVDGANAWQRFVHVTIPSISTSLALVTLTTISGAINNFNGIWLFTRGGPNGATEILTTYAYRTAFMQFDFGKASAISVLIFLIMMVLAVTYFIVVEGRQNRGSR